MTKRSRKVACARASSAITNGRTATEFPTESNAPLRRLALASSQSGGVTAPKSRPALLFTSGSGASGTRSGRKRSSKSNCARPYSVSNPEPLGSAWHATQLA